MNYSGLSIVAMKAAQEQLKRITTLETKNEALKKELAEIRLVLDQLLDK